MQGHQNEALKHDKWFETDLNRVFALQICQLFQVRNNQICFDERRFNCTDKGWQSENNCFVSSI